MPTASDTSYLVSDFPWPMVRGEQMDAISAMCIVEHARDLTLEQRCLAVYIAGGWGGPNDASEGAGICDALGITPEKYVELLWDLRVHGILRQLAGRWAR